MTGFLLFIVLVYIFTGGDCGNSAVGDSGCQLAEMFASAVAGGIEAGMAGFAILS